MKKLVLGSLLVTLTVGSVMTGFNLYIESKNPVGKCYKLSDTGGNEFAERLTFKVLKKSEQSLDALLVDFKQPEDLEQTLLVLQFTTSGVQLLPDAIERKALKRVDCPVQSK